MATYQYDVRIKTGIDFPHKEIEAVNKVAEKIATASKVSPLMQSRIETAKLVAKAIELENARRNIK